MRLRYDDAGKLRDLKEKYERPLYGNEFSRLYFRIVPSTVRRGREIVARNLPVMDINLVDKPVGHNLDKIARVSVST